MTARPVVVVGAGLAGWRVADGIARHAPGIRVVVLGEEELPPYDRPPLSKKVLLGERSLEDLRLAPDALPPSIELRLGARFRVAGSDGSTVLLASGEHIEAEHVVWATGVRPALPAWASGVGAHVLRTARDALQLRERLEPGAVVAVVGGGFIGCEIAASAVRLGLHVEMIEAADRLIARSVPEPVSEAVRRLHEGHGVVVRTGATVRSVERESPDARTRIRLSDGSEVAADVVAVGVGAVVDDGPLAGLDLDLGGIACDSRGRIVGADRAWAVGDVASWFDPVLGCRRRREHWSTASHQAALVAAQIADLELDLAALVEPPYAWSDQYDLKVQTLGWPELGDRWEVLEGDLLEGGRRGAIGRFDGDNLCAVVTVGTPRLLLRHRPRVSEFAQRRVSALHAARGR